MFKTLMAISLVLNLTGCIALTDKPDETACAQPIKNYMANTVDLYGDYNETYLTPDDTFITVFVHFGEDDSVKYTYFEYAKEGGSCTITYSYGMREEAEEVL